MMKMMKMKKMKKMKTAIGLEQAMHVQIQVHLEHVYHAFPFYKYMYVTHTHCKINIYDVIRSGVIWCNLV